MTCTNYDIDGWHVQFPQEWKFSLDKDQQPPQIIFDVEEEPVTIYISTWNWIRPETEEVPDVETVSRLLQGRKQKFVMSFTICM